MKVSLQRYFQDWTGTPLGQFQVEVTHEPIEAGRLMVFDH
jgi:hypothetical protein